LLIDGQKLIVQVSGHSSAIAEAKIAFSQQSEKSLRFLQKVKQVKDWIATI
jgi:hypothetical protein